MSTENKHEKGMRVWIPHKNNVWESAIILEDYNANQNKLFVQGDDSRQMKILDINVPTELPPLHLLEDSSIDMKHNLSKLAVIHEATILQTLRARFERRCCYSYCGISTIALNPFSESSENETDKISYYRNSNLRNLNAHVFGVAERVYRNLEREKCDQMIIFTGESGAGKTTNAERAILYLTTISSKDKKIREKVLASSVILKAFGHANTTVNHDSSRFGKFIEIQYDNNYHIIGASLKAYNLDRSKILSQVETIYNIFYYMFAVKENLPQLQLDECQFDYLNKMTDIEAYNTQNKEYFAKTIKAFNSLEFSEKEQAEIFNILAILLHLQSITFKKIEGDEISQSTESCTITDVGYLKVLGKVSDIDEKTVNNMRKWMCYKRTFYEQNEMLEPLSLDQAIKARDALAKFIYTKMFNWLLARINESLRSPCNVQSFIGVLDMPGFETLDSNSFEQFCINYVDERVQQFSTQLHFKLEQEEYLKENIGWTSSVGFVNNLACLELIEGKLGIQAGILDLLEKENKMPSEDNRSWFEKVRLEFDKVQNFEKSKEMTNFTIHHFIRPVQYDATDFSEKNSVSVAKEQLEVMREIKNDLLNRFVNEELSKLNGTKTNVTKNKRKSRVTRRSSFSSKSIKNKVTSELRTSLYLLVATLKNTKLSFVRCIKTNDEKKPSTFDSQRVAEQLRAFNICQTVQLSASGYFQHKSFKEFFQRYHCLSEFQDRKLEQREICKWILAAYKEDDVKFGTTTVFFREDTLDDLESQRAVKRQNASIVIQKWTRRFEQQNRYNKMRRSIYGIQRYAREYLLRQQMQVNLNNSVEENVDFLEEKTDTSVFDNIVEENVDCLKEQIDTSVLNKSVEENVDFLKEQIDTSVLNKSVEENVDSLEEATNTTVLDNNVEENVDFLEEKTYTCVLSNSVEKNVDFLEKKTDSQIQHSQPANNNNVNQYGGAPEYDDKESHKKLFESFEGADRDAKTLQHASNIQDAQISNIMKCYKDSLKSRNTTGISVIHTEISTEKYHIKAAKVCKEQHRKQKSSMLDGNQSSSCQTRTINKEDLQELSRYSFSKLIGKQEEKTFDPDGEKEEKRTRQLESLRLFFAQMEALADPTAATFDLAYEEMLKGKLEAEKNLRSMLSEEEMLKRKLEAQRKFQSIMRDVRDNSFDKQSTGEVAYVGMFEFDLKTVATVIYHLTDVNPEIFFEYDLSSDLPAQILMMCIRYSDYKNDLSAALSLIDNFIKRVKFNVEAHESLHLTVFWFSNTFHLLNYLKQYSKPDEKTNLLDQFHAYNNSRKNEQRLKNIDLRSSWITLEQTCNYFVNQIIKDIKTGNITLHLEVDTLLNELTVYYDDFVKYSLDRQIVLQIFKPIFDYINSVTLSNMLSQSNLCSVFTSMEIRHNLRSLERWAIDRKLALLIDLLSPVTQAIRFLQMQPISQNDIIYVRETFNALSANQILKLVEQYNANCSVEFSVSLVMIDILKLIFQYREDLDDTIPLDPEEYAIKFPFRHSRVRLEEVEIPQRMNLPMLKKI